MICSPRRRSLFGLARRHRELGPEIDELDGLTAPLTRSIAAR
ncbi:hypothetical protein ABT218_36935 [Streptomyces sp. NPDC001455]